MRSSRWILMRWTAGFLLPGEADPVWAGDIDRMFISLVPPIYDGGDGVLAAPVEGWARPAFDVLQLEDYDWVSHLLRGRAGTASAMTHAAGAPFVLLDDSAPLLLPDALAIAAESGSARLQWAPRGGTAMTEVAVTTAGAALSPLAPVHGRILPDGAGGVLISWRRRSRVDTGWRDHVDLPIGEGQEAWRITLSPPVPGVAPWERSAPDLHIAAAVLAGLPPETMIEVRQVGDFALSLPLALSLT